MSLTKVCSCCGTSKPLTDFYKHPSIKPDGIRKQCKICRNKYRRSAHEKNPSAKNNTAKKWRDKNKEKLAAIQRENRKKDPARFKGYHLKKDFNISYSDYTRMLEEQNGVCAICIKPEKARHQNGKIKDLAVDHCRSTGKIRALLCWTCNTGIGKLQHSPILLRRSALYLEKYK